MNERAVSTFRFCFKLITLLPKLIRVSNVTGDVSRQSHRGIKTKLNSTAFVVLVY